MNAVLLASLVTAKNLLFILGVMMFVMGAAKLLDGMGVINKSGKNKKTGGENDGQR